MTSPPTAARDPAAEIASLLDWRHRVADLYRTVRGTAGPERARARFRRERDRLFASHPQSPLADRTAFAGLPYFPYDPDWRVTARLEPESADAAPDPALGPARFAVALRDDGELRLRRVGRLAFERGGATHRLSLYRLEGYGGGLFLPFGDATNRDATYGGGRYLLDTRKGADLGWRHGAPVLDFNFAYHPSCAYGPAWDCPLAPPENRLPIPVEAGERLP